MVMRKNIFCLLLALSAMIAAAATPGDALTCWRAGAVVDSAAVARYGIERCFASEPIPDAVFERMKGKSYKDNCTIPRDELRYLRLLHYNAEGKLQLGEMVCNRAIADDVVDIFRNLFRQRYIIERMVLIDDYDANDERSMTANNTSCFCFRPVSGTAVLSNHSRGLAVDVNPLYNPYVKRRDGRVIVEPEAGRPYIKRHKKFRQKIDVNDACYKEFVRHGFTWGGSWNSVKDYQHFEKP